MGGGVQLGSMGVTVEVGGGRGGGEVSIGGSRQLVPRKRHNVIVRQVNRYFMLALLIVDYIIVARGQN